MKTADIVIVGGGVVGASVAYHLAKRGAGIVKILERSTTQGTGSTGAATGGIRAQFGTEINIRMSLYSLEFFENCEFDPEYEPKGYLFFTTDQERLLGLRESVATQRGLGVDVEVIDRETIAEMVPGMNCEDIVGGSFGAHDGFVNPIAIMRGFTREAAANGAELEFGVNATSIITEAGRVLGVQTEKGVIECGQVVICTGAHAAQLAATAGIDLPVVPQRRQIVWGTADRPLPPKLPMVIDIGNGFHFRPARDFTDSERAADPNDVIFAYPDANGLSSTACDFDELFIEKVSKLAKERADFLREPKIDRSRCRAGLYENTPDHHAILGACHVNGLYFASGFSGHGVMHSPATGRALSEIMLDGRSRSIDVSCLSLDRFAKGEMLHETAFI